MKKRTIYIPYDFDDIDNTIKDPLFENDDDCFDGFIFLEDYETEE